MATSLALSSTPEPLPLGGLSDPILVDPGLRLLRAVVEAYREVAPSLVAPSVAELAGEAGEEGSPKAADLPPLKLFAGEAAVDAATAGFRPASRLAALLDADAVDLRVLDAPQPNPVLAGAETGFALIGSEADEGGEEAAEGTGRWHRVGDDASLRDRYAAGFADAEAYGIRTPSRRRAYEGFAARCDESVAAAVLRALDVEQAASEGPDPEETRVRAYAVGAREGVLDRTLRRACEDAGLGSPSTFTRVKRLLREADLIETVSEPQPVGRPRERLAARGALAAAETPAELVGAVRNVTE
ncbi:MAG: transcriptional regulator TbsP domain-containing protein [Methanobacteriota archaeon]